jgi:hypothetical protein
MGYGMAGIDPDWPVSGALRIPDGHSLRVRTLRVAIDTGVLVHAGDGSQRLSLITMEVWEV